MDICAGVRTGAAVFAGLLSGVILLGTPEAGPLSPSFSWAEEGGAGVEFDDFRKSGDDAARIPSFEGPWKGGAYMCSSPGMDSDIWVQLYVEDGVIRKVTAFGGATSGFAEMALLSLCESVVAAQGTAGVDAVAGATATSEAFLKAVDRALFSASDGRFAGEHYVPYPVAALAFDVQVGGLSLRLPYRTGDWGDDRFYSIVGDDIGVLTDVYRSCPSPFAGNDVATTIDALLESVCGVWLLNEGVLYGEWRYNEEGDVEGVPGDVAERSIAGLDGSECLAYDVAVDDGRVLTFAFVRTSPDTAALAVFMRFGAERSAAVERLVDELCLGLSAVPAVSGGEQAAPAPREVPENVYGYPENKLGEAYGALDDDARANRCRLADDASFLIVDTSVDEEEVDKKGYYAGFVDDDAYFVSRNDIIKTVNDYLGLPDWLWDDMQNTSHADGTLSRRIGDYEVDWSYEVRNLCPTFLVMYRYVGPSAGALEQGGLAGSRINPGLKVPDDLEFAYLLPTMSKVEQDAYLERLGEQSGDGFVLADPVECIQDGRLWYIPLRTISSDDGLWSKEGICEALLLCGITDPIFSDEASCYGFTNGDSSDVVLGSYAYKVQGYAGRTISVTGAWMFYAGEEFAAIGIVGPE